MLYRVYGLEEFSVDRLVDGMESSRGGGILVASCVVGDLLAGAELREVRLRWFGYSLIDDAAAKGE